MSHLHRRLPASRIPSFHASFNIISAWSISSPPSFPSFIRLLHLRFHRFLLLLLHNLLLIFSHTLSSIFFSLSFSSTSSTPPSSTYLLSFPIFPSYFLLLPPNIPLCYFFFFPINKHHCLPTTSRLGHI